LYGDLKVKSNKNNVLSNFWQDLTGGSIFVAVILLKEDQHVSNSSYRALGYNGTTHGAPNLTIKKIRPTGFNVRLCAQCNHKNSLYSLMVLLL